MACEDNREEAPGRLFGVAEQHPPERPDLAEHQVTELLGRTLGDLATRVRPSGADLAGVAIKRARRVQRRRRGAGLVAVVVATVSVSGALLMGLSGSGETDRGDGSIAGLFSDEDEREEPAPVGPPDQPTRDVSLAADEAVVERVSGGLVGEGDSDGLVLATGDGVLADLGPIRDVNSVHRVAEGWVVVTAGAGADTARLWWVTDSGKPRAVLSGLDEIVADGARAAWRLGSQLSAGVLADDGGLQRRGSVQAPAGDVRLAGFVGEAVLLRRVTGGGAVSWALWRPEECVADPCPGFDPVWSPHVLRVYGTEPGGGAAIGLVPAVSKDQGVCLARLRIADGLPVIERVCPPDLPTGVASLSPDGRWLVAAVGSGGGGAAVVDVAAAFAGDPEAVLPVPGVAAPAAVPVWSAPAEAVYPTEDSLVWVRAEKLRNGGKDAVTEAALSGAPPTLIHMSR